MVCFVYLPSKGLVSLKYRGPHGHTFEEEISHFNTMSQDLDPEDGELELTDHADNEMPIYNNPYPLYPCWSNFGEQWSNGMDLDVRAYPDTIQKLNLALEKIPVGPDLWEAIYHPYGDVASLSAFNYGSVDSSLLSSRSNDKRNGNSWEGRRRLRRKALQRKQLSILGPEYRRELT